MHSAAEVPADFEAFRGKAYALTGLDLTSYKAPQMHRRLTALMARHKIANFAEYARVLKADSQRRQEFKDYVTINVTEFFRDSDRFGDLERRVLPMLLANGRGLKVWSAGCSTGAEAYTLSILLNELAPGRGHSILATDIDETILDTARAGSGYLANDLRNAGPARIRRWFAAAPDGRFSIAARVRTAIRFQKHDLLRDPYPRGPFDLIACRNVVIYFTEQAKERIYAGFVDALSDGGVLFVGGTEAIMRPQALGLTVLGAGFYRKPERPC
jgi:chemotaxis protein methyltransferase CheR